MASVLMAMDDFNSRNSSIVPGLDELTADCPAQFDMNKSAFFDAGTIRHSGIRSLVTQLPELPCAAVGPYTDEAAIELSTMAAAFEFPLTVHRSFSLRVSGDYASPYSNMVYPDIITTTVYAIDLLIRRGRTNFIAFLYPLTETGTQWRETVTVILEESEMRYVASSYNSDKSPAKGATRNMTDALLAIKKSGYRTILVSPQDPLLDIPLMAGEAVSLGLTNGEYVFVFMGAFDYTILDSGDPDIFELLKGSLLIQPYETIWLDDDPFLIKWRSQGPDAVRRLKEFSPIKLGKDGHAFDSSTTDVSSYVTFRDNFFQTNQPLFGSGYVYDAVIATGLGACAALAESSNKTVIVDSFVKGIRSASFMGVSGSVRFGCEGCNFPSTRAPMSSDWVVFNLFPKISGENGISTSSFQLVEIYSEGEPKVLNDTYYANGLTSPPALLRDQPEQNYLSSAVRAVGFTGLGFSLLCSVAAMIWVYIHRKHRVLRASQPFFLYLLCLGAIISVSAIFPASFDEGSGWSESQLSNACVVIPWLFSTGYVLVYGALFGKLWRINKVLQAVRRKINMKQVGWPCVIFLVLALIILGLWTGIDPLQWTREEIDDETGETIGSCHSNHVWTFLAPLVILMLVPTLLTEWMAWRTKDIDDEYAESRWIFIMVLVQCEVILFAVPLVAVLRDVSPDGRYLGFVALLFTLPTSAVALIIGPKVWAYRNHQLGRAVPTRRRGATRGEVRVTGIGSTQTSIQTCRASCSSVPETQST